MNALYLSGMHRALTPLTGGMGLIFTLHHVKAEAPAAFSPNRILAITPDFLEAVIVRVREQGLEFVSLDEARYRIISGRRRGRFVCLTFDDGYRDNLDIAYPVLRRHKVPFTIYVTTCLPEATARLWWLVLERIIAGSMALEVSLDGEERNFDCRSVAAKYDAYEAIYWRLRRLPESQLRLWIDELAVSHAIDMSGMARSLSMSWAEIGTLAQDPLCTIGAHTLSHPALAKLSDAEAELEMAESRKLIGDTIGKVPRHFAYPYGDAASAGAREFACAERLGFATGVTTRPGVLFSDHGHHLTALPRVSLNGDYQSLRYLDLFLSGAPFALWNRFRRVQAA